MDALEVQKCDELQWPAMLLGCGCMTESLSFEILINFLQKKDLSAFILNI